MKRYAAVVSRRCSVKNLQWKHSQISRENGSFFINKDLQLYHGETPAQVLFCGLSEIFNKFIEEHLLETASRMWTEAWEESSRIPEQIQIICSSTFIIDFELYLILILWILKSDSHLPKKIYFICFNVSSPKMMKNAFYFILKARFVLKIFKFLSWLFGHAEKTAWLER